MKNTKRIFEAPIPLDDPAEAQDTPPPQAGGADDMPLPEPEAEEPPAMDAPMPGGEGGGGERPPYYDPAQTDDQPAPGLDDPDAAEQPKAAEGTGAITGKYNSSPVGDIKMSKAKGTYNTYKLEMSMGQLEVIRTALEGNHADPVSDELLATLTYYMDKLPGPGEEEEEAEARVNPQAAAAKAAKAAGLPGAETPDAEESDSPLPKPPGAPTAAKVGAADISKLPKPPKGGATPAKERLLQNSPNAQPSVGLPEPEDVGSEAQLPPPPRE